MDSSSHHLITLFSLSSYRALLSAYSALPAPISPLVTLYAARSNLGLTPPNTSECIKLLDGIEESFDTRAIRGLAEYLAAQVTGFSNGEEEEPINELEFLMTELGESGLDDSNPEEEGRYVRSIIATVWILESLRTDEGIEDELREARREEAIEILKEGIELGRDQECLAILTHLYIAISLPSLSSSLLAAPSTTSFTSDSLLSQLLKARTNLAMGPAAKYQEAFYVYEEMRGMQGGRTEDVLGGVGVAQAAMGRWEESTSAVAEGLEANPDHATSLANTVALGLHAGKTSAAIDVIYSKLATLHPSHSLVQSINLKSAEFDAAASGFGIGL